MTSGQELPPSLAAELARLYAPYHNLVYFAPEVQAFKEVGLKGWWMAYFQGGVPGQWPPAHLRRPNE